MTRNQALAEAVKRWGKKAAIQDGGKRRASTPEARARASSELKELRANKPVAPSIFDLETWPASRSVAEFRAARLQYVADLRKWTANESRLFGEALAMRFDVGVVGWAFEIRGSGDTWEDAFANADGKFKAPPIV